MARTFAMIKPDAMQKSPGVLAEIIEIYLQPRPGKIPSRIAHWKYLEQMPRELAKELYQEHDGKPYYDQLIDFTLSGPVVALVIEGDADIVEHIRSLNGATNPSKAEDGTIRYYFGARGSEWTGQQNAVHASDSPESAEREITIFFPDTESV